MRVPLCAGHEGAGIVRDIGPDVTRVRPGDHVVLCWAPPCGTCPPCAGGTPLYLRSARQDDVSQRLPFGGTRLKAGGDEVAPFLGTACFASTCLPESG